MILSRSSYSIAYDHVSSRSGQHIQPGLPCVIFCSGFNSTKQGTKALALEALCVQQGIEFIRFDYGGHGDSGGVFADGCITSWLEDTLDVIEQLPKSKDVVLVGSSMGGWISLLAALQNPSKVRGLLLVACAADMTHHYPRRLKGRIAENDEMGRSYYELENEFDDQLPYRIYQKLIDDGESHALLQSPIELSIPVRLIHGVDDEVVEWQRSERVLNCLTSSNVTLQLIKGADHRLSEQSDIDCINRGLLDLLQLVRGPEMRHPDR